MSCGGNRFQCNLTKSSRHQFKPDKPSNPQLHNENQKRLNDLLKARDEIDKQFISLTNNNSSDMAISNYQEISTITYTPWLTNIINDENFTPWKTPSTSDYSSKSK